MSDTDSSTIAAPRRFPTVESVVWHHHPEWAYLADPRAETRAPTSAEIAAYAARREDPAFAAIYAPGVPALLPAPSHAPRLDPLPVRVPGRSVTEAAIPAEAAVPVAEVLPALPVPDSHKDTSEDKAMLDSESARAGGTEPEDSAEGNGTAAAQASSAATLARWGADPEAVGELVKPPPASPAGTAEVPADAPAEAGGEASQP
jgi:hypothetical protein